MDNIKKKISLERKYILSKEQSQSRVHKDLTTPLCGFNVFMLDVRL